MSLSGRIQQVRFLRSEDFPSCTALRPSTWAISKKLLSLLVQACEDAWKIDRWTLIFVCLFCYACVFWFSPAFSPSLLLFLLLTRLVVVVTHSCCGTRRQHLIFSRSCHVRELSSSCMNFPSRVRTVFVMYVEPSSLCESFTLSPYCCACGLLFYLSYLSLSYCSFSFLVNPWIFITII